MKYRIICLALVLLIIVTPSGVATAQMEREQLTIPILLYHAIEESFPVDISNLAITTAGFEEHMLSLLRAGYTPISFSQYYDFVNGGAALPSKPVLITFDDGYLSNYEKAFPILQKYNIKATIFVVADTVGATKGVYYPHFNWWQALAMIESGLIEIGSHTLTHQDLRQFSPEQLQMELRLSKYLIESNLHKPCNLLSYPFGYYNEEVENAAVRAGYKMICLVEDRGVNLPGTPLTRLKRLTINGFSSGEDLIKIIALNTDIELNDTAAYHTPSVQEHEQIILQYDIDNKHELEFDLDAENPNKD